MSITTTPLKVAQNELRELKSLLIHVSNPTSYKYSNCKVDAVQKQVDAFQKLVDDPTALNLWWASISPDGQRLLLDTL